SVARVQRLARLFGSVPRGGGRHTFIHVGPARASVLEHGVPADTTRAAHQASHRSSGILEDYTSQGQNALPLLPYTRSVFVPKQPSSSCSLLFGSSHLPLLFYFFCWSDN